MLSQNETRVRELIETKLLGNDREETLLYHFSVGRKLRAVELFYSNIKNIFIPQFSGTATLSASSISQPPGQELIDLSSLIDDASANIDAFFMSAKSALDSFAHELRSLYGFGGHTGDLYVENAVELVSTNHSDTALQTYFNSSNLRDSDWFTDLKRYRRACTHESIIPFKPSFDFDLISGQWKELFVKLPLNPGTFPPVFDNKNFIGTGETIKEGLRIFLISSYDKVFTDILDNKTKIVP